MAKNSVDAYGAEGKTNLLYFDPDKLELVTDPAHALYDERVHRPFNEARVLNMMALGVLVPIVISKERETGRVLVADGRGRVIDAREANRRLRARGEEPLQVPATVRTADVANLAAVMVSANELREADAPLNRARKMQQMKERGRGDDALAIIFGCTEQTVRQTLALLDQPSAVRQAVEAGQITVTAAQKIAKLTPDQQRSKVAELVKAGEGTTGHARAKAQRAVIGDDKPKMRSRKEVAAEMAKATGIRKATLAWVLALAEEAEA